MTAPVNRVTALLRISDRAGKKDGPFEGEFRRLSTLSKVKVAQSAGGSEVGLSGPLVM